jgi:hypothetical protein
MDGLFFFEVLNVALVETMSFEMEEKERRSLLREVVVAFSGETIFVICVKGRGFSED